MSDFPIQKFEEKTFLKPHCSAPHDAKKYIYLRSTSIIVSMVYDPGEGNVRCDSDRIESKVEETFF